MRWPLRLVLWDLAALLSFNICVGSGLITAWGRWYSPSIPYREQTEALLSGQLALSHLPTAIEDDFVWAEGGLQQVWGLGVPCWRLPFEILAKLFGQPAFPDRIVLTITISLVCYLVLRALTVPDGVKRLDDWVVEQVRSPLELGAALLLTLFPPIINLSRGPFKVYEEAVVYGYYFAVLLFVLTLAFSRRPTTRLYILLSLLGGLAAFVRPTIGAYGLATMIVAGAISRNIGWTWRRSLLGPAAFGLGCGLLFWTNWKRFGSGFEFGHKLTRTSVDLMYLLRFPSPFNEEPFWPAAKELIGWLFFARNYEELASWQSGTPRWREFYHTTFSWPYLVAVGACLGLAMWRLTRNRKNGSAGVSAADLVPAAWSTMSLVALFAFYLRLPAISSRYMLDFAPGICVAFVGCLQAAECWSRLTLSRLRAFVVTGLLTALVTWWTFEIVAAQHYFPPTFILTEREIVARMSQKSPEFLGIPKSYSASTNPAKLTGIPHNGTGWTHPSGHTESMVVLFVESPENLRLEVVPTEGGAPTEESLASISAKVGLEFLELKSIESSTNGRILTFSAPRRNTYRHGVQIVFIAFVPPNEFQKHPSRFRLLRADW